MGILVGLWGQAYPTAASGFGEDKHLSLLRQTNERHAYENSSGTSHFRLYGRVLGSPNEDCCTGYGDEVEK